MRIALLIYGSLDTLSGGYLYDRKLVDTLLAAGDSVEVISLPWRTYPQHLLDNVNLNLLQRLRKLSVDVLLQDELNHPSLFLLNRFLGGRKPPYPIVGIVHHLRSDESHPRLWNRLYTWVERRYLLTLDHAIYNSETTQNRVRTVTGRDLPGLVSPPAADHLPVPTIIHRPHRRGMSPMLGLAPAPVRLVSVGAVIPRKRYHLLLDALAQLSPGQWQLDIAGSLQTAPDYVASLQAQIKCLGLTDAVTLHGRISEEDLCQLYRRSHAMALLSYEGFGIAFLEAFAYGLPVLAAHDGAASELITHGRNGWLVDPYIPDQVVHSLEKWTDEPDCLIRMGRAARRRFDRHPTWSETSRHTRQYLLDLTG